MVMLNGSERALALKLTFACALLRVGGWGLGGLGVRHKRHIRTRANLRGHDASARVCVCACARVCVHAGARRCLDGVVEGLEVAVADDRWVEVTIEQRLGEAEVLACNKARARLSEKGFGERWGGGCHVCCGATVPVRGW
eukprot:4056644-Pleurochrysis_carterae.AAC.1